MSFETVILIFKYAVFILLGKSQRMKKREVIHPKHGGFFILQLHDELLYEVAEDNIIQV